MANTAAENPSHMEKMVQEEMDTNTNTGSITMDAERRSEASTVVSDAEGKEKVASGPSPSQSSEIVAEEKAEQKEGGQAPGAEEQTPEERRTKSKTALIMFSLCMGVFLAALDITIITTALPTIAQHYDASASDYTWIGSSYLLAASAATPTWGKISDIFGRKPIVLAANVVFFVGSLICALSININMLIAGRVLQGIGGGGLIVLVSICISDLFSMRNRGMYYGIIGMVWAIASALGPILGGLFTEYVTWRWCFYINLPCDGLAFIIIFIFLDIETPKTPLLAGLKAIDWSGSLLIVGGTLMFLFGLEYGGVSSPWASAKVICLIVFGFFTIGLFFVNEWKFAKYPIMPIRIFSNRSNIAALLTCFVHGSVFISGSYFLPLYFQSVLGATPLLSGVYLFPFVLSLSFVSAGTGVFIRKTGQYLPPIWAGLAFMTLGFGLFISLPNHADWAKIIIFQIIAGMGVGTNFQSPLIALQSHVAPRDIATATATFGFTRNLATSISVVVGGVIFQNGMQKRSSQLVSALGPKLAGELSGGSAGANIGVVNALPPAQRAVATAAYTESLRIMWIFYTVLALVGLCISFAIGKQKLSKKHETHKTGLAGMEEDRKERKEKKRAKGMGKEGVAENGGVAAEEAAPEVSK